MNPMQQSIKRIVEEAWRGVSTRSTVRWDDQQGKVVVWVNSTSVMSVGNHISIVAWTATIDESELIQIAQTVQSQILQAHNVTYQIINGTDDTMRPDKSSRQFRRRNKRGSNLSSTIPGGPMSMGRGGRGGRS